MRIKMNKCVHSVSVDNCMVWMSIFMIALILSGCKKFLQIDAPKESLVTETVFDNDDIATSAVTGIYIKMANNQGLSSINTICGLSADELISYNINHGEFYENQINPINTHLNTIYFNSYNYIFTANAILEGLNASNHVSLATKAQLQGEAYFIRAFNYFYLVNLFGQIPLNLITDYRITRLEPRASVDRIYQQILIDLKAAEGLLKNKYITTERVRPNLSAVQALLARVYLFRQDWSNAEKYASLVIDNTATYSLVAVDNVFLKNSGEAIWQLFPPVNSNAVEGFNFILVATPGTISLKSEFAIGAFEINDRRKISWVKSFTNNTGTYYYPYKYKIRSSTVVSEYSMVLRLAEQFLIRSESRAEQNNLNGAIDDLDKIRERAGLTLIKQTKPGISKMELLSSIQKERKVELFTEWGHRWLDLKRTGQASAILQPLKTHWKSTAILYPLPENEVNRNPNIGGQNDGY
jgi:hypothetical protein